MKLVKLAIVAAALLSLSACSNLTNYQIKYEQQGKNCKYSEITGTYQPGIFGNKYRVIGIHEITYPDTICKEVVQSDLKNGINKTASSPIGAYRGPVFGYEKDVYTKEINVD